MSDLRPDEIEQGWDLFNKGKEEEALELITEFDNKEDLNPEENLRCQILKGMIKFFLGEFEEALKIGCS